MLTSDSKPLTVSEKTAYGLGDMASNFYMGFFGIFLLYYYTDVWGIHPAHAAFMFLITRIIDAISDPAMGLIADRTETRWGKYRPYLIWMALPYALLGYLLFLGPDLSATGKLIYAYVSYSLIMLVYTMINVPYSALLAVIHPSSDERTKATQYRFVFASLGTLTVGAIAKPLVDWLGAGDEVAGFRLTIILFAILSIALFVVTFLGTKERIKPIKQKPDVKAELQALIKNISWLVLALAGILIVIGLITRISSAAFFTKYYLAADETKLLWWMDGTSLLVTTGFVGQLFGALLTPTLLRAFDKRDLLIAACVFASACLGLCHLVTANQYWIALSLHTGAIFAFGIMITLLFAMYTDCVQYGEWQTGRSSAGLTVSASMFSLKAGSALGAAIPAAILAWFGFVANEVQTDQSIQGIRIMFNLAPAAFFLGAAILMVFYRIDKRLLDQIEDELSKSRLRA